MRPDNIKIIQIDNHIYVDMDKDTAIEEHENSFKGEIQQIKELTAWRGCAYIKDNKVKEV